MKQWADLMEIVLLMVVKVVDLMVMQLVMLSVMLLVAMFIHVSVFTIKTNTFMN